MIRSDERLPGRTVSVAGCSQQEVLASKAVGAIRRGTAGTAVQSDGAMLGTILTCGPGAVAAAAAAAERKTGADMVIAGWARSGTHGAAEGCRRGQTGHRAGADPDGGMVGVAEVGLADGVVVATGDEDVEKGAAGRVAHGATVAASESGIEQTTVVDRRGVTLYSAEEIHGRDREVEAVAVL